MSKRVEVYYNLHKKCLSVRDKKTKRVIDHVEDIRLSNCRFIVQPAGHRKVMETGHKNVHAWVEGTLPDKWLSKEIYDRGAKVARYEPFNANCVINGKPTFIDHHSYEPVREASQVEIRGKVIYYD